LKRKLIAFKEGPLTKNGSMDFAQSWAIHMKKSYLIYAEEKKGVASQFWTHKMHVKRLI
jgi:hypothetical protein